MREECGVGWWSGGVNPFCEPIFRTPKSPWKGDFAQGFPFSGSGASQIGFILRIGGLMVVGGLLNLVDFFC